MKKIFRGQVILSAVYTVTAIVVFLYTLVFMTEYNDLFGLKMPQNKQIAQFYEVILQGFNRQILVWAIVGIIGILMIVLLEIRTAVPDRFAAAVMTVYMGCCCFGAVNAIRNILAIWAYYKGLDFQYLYSMSRSSVIVLWSWQLLQRGCQFFSSQNKSGSPRCGLI